MYADSERIRVRDERQGVCGKRERFFVVTTVVRIRSCRSLHVEHVPLTHAQTRQEGEREKESGKQEMRVRK